MDSKRRAVVAAGVGLVTGAAMAAGRAGSPAASKVKWVKLREGHRVWTRRIGEGGPKVLLLHGGPGFSHDYFECFADFLPPAGIEMYFYDQLGCGHSDRPEDPLLWNLSRYVDEVEQVREALGLDDFILFGHSWGAVLGIEYALKFGKQLRGLVLSNMTASMADYAAYTNQLKDQLPKPIRDRLTVLEQAGARESEVYSGLILEHLYPKHICRVQPFPEPVQRTLERANVQIYRQMQGVDEFIVNGNLRDWDRWRDLPRISSPTLVMGAKHDEMNPESLRREAELIPNAQLFISSVGSHLTMWDDQQAYFDALIRFILSLGKRATTP